MSKPQKITVALPELPEGAEEIRIYTAWSPEVDSMLYGPASPESFSPLTLQAIVKPGVESEPSKLRYRVEGTDDGSNWFPLAAAYGTLHEATDLVSYIAWDYPRGIRIRDLERREVIVEGPERV